MFELLNIFIINRSKYISWLFIILLSIISNCVLFAQEEVLPIIPSNLRQVKTDVFAYISSEKSTRLTTLNNGSALYSNTLETGLLSELYFNDLPRARLGCSLGYKNECMSKNELYTSKGGLYSHWITADIFFSTAIIGFGIKSDVLLCSKLKKSNLFIIDGIYPDCINKFSLASYLTFCFQTTHFKVMFNLGMDLIPSLNPTKISYYNMSHLRVSRFYFEVKLCYRIFTTGKAYDAPLYL